MALKPVPAKSFFSPRPPRSSITRALYDAVHAAGGAATLREINELLPATDDAAKLISRSKKRLHAGLNNCVYRGYLVHSDRDQTYQIAPLAYYETRYAFIKEIEHRSANRQPRLKRRKSTVGTVVTVTNWKLTGIIGWAAFFLGVIAGSLL